MDQVIALFHSDGDGLPKQAILQDMARLYGLLDVMSLDTSKLIAKYRVRPRASALLLPFHASHYMVELLHRRCLPPAHLDGVVACRHSLQTQTRWARGRCCSACWRTGLTARHPSG